MEGDVFNYETAFGFGKSAIGDWLHRLPGKTHPCVCSG
jgi:hypothetical protein